MNKAGSVGDVYGKRIELYNKLDRFDCRIAACQQRRKAAIMRAARAINSDEGALTVC